MATNYPGALDNDATVGGGSKPAASTALDASGSGHPVHSAMHQNVGDAIEQIQTKLGTGASTPAANKALVANGTASEWGQITGPMITNGAVGNDQLVDDPTFTNISATSLTATGTVTGDTVSAVSGLSSGGGVTVAAGTAGSPSLRFDGDPDTGIYRSAADELSFTTGGNQALKIRPVGDIRLQREGIVLDANQKTYWSLNPVEAAGNDCEWVSYTGYYYMARNSSTAASKENITSDLGTHLTANMIDSVVPKMWNRKTAPGIPEIGPIADDMDSVSPFLTAHGTDANGDQILTGINKTAWMSLMTLALQDIRTRLAALEG